MQAENVFFIVKGPSTNFVHLNYVLFVLAFLFFILILMV